MKSLIKNGMTMLCLAVIIAVALPADAKSKKDKKLKDWQIVDTFLQDQIDAIEGLPDGENPGDILYWDGSVWQSTPAPLDDTGSPPPTLTLCDDGVPTWSSTACDTGSVARTGVFLDSPVSNIGYRTETKDGVTNEFGEYDYLPGETVTFFIGDLEFPPTTATGTVTPLELAGTRDTSDPKVVNIIRLLQTLDADGDPDNGIKIPDSIVAAQVDFNLTVTDFQNDLAVVTLVDNYGSNEGGGLISPEQAIANFEETLESEDIDFVPNATIRGVWTIDLGDDVLLVLAFFDDGNYLHMEVDDEIDEEEGEFSGMEWGTYTRNAETGEVSATNIFDNNGYIGLHPEVTDGTVQLFAHVSGDVLTLSSQYEEDGDVVNESFVLDRAASSGLLGLWTTDLTNNELLAFIFFDDGTYVHLEVDEEEPSDPDEDSGMEWGTYTRNAETGELLSITNLFDNNGDTGLNPSYANDPGGLFLNVSGDVLTLETDDEFFTFERQ